MRYLLPFLVFLCASPLWGQSADRRELPSGLRLITYELSRTHAIEVRVVVRAGPTYEGEHLGSGISHLLATMVAASAQTPDRAARIQRLGDDLRFETASGYTAFAIHTTDRKLGEALALLAELLHRPNLDADALERAKEGQLQGIARRHRDAVAREEEAIRRTVYAEHPARISKLGAPELLGALTAEEVAAYHARRYTAPNLTVVVAGNVTASSVRRQATEAFAGYPRGGWDAGAKVDESPQVHQRVRRYHFDVTSTVHAYAWRTTGFAHADQPVLDLIAILLDAPDLHDLRRTLSLELLADDFRVENRRAPRRPGYFLIRYRPKQGRASDAAQAIHAALEELAEHGPDARALAAAKRELYRRHTEADADARLVSRRLALWDLAINDTPPPRDVLGVQTADVQRVAGKWLSRKGSNRNHVIIEKSTEEEVPVVGPRPVLSDAPPRIETGSSGVRLLLRNLGKGLVRVRVSMGRDDESRERLGIHALLADLLAKGPAIEGVVDEADRSSRFRRELTDYGMRFRAYPTPTTIELEITCFQKDVARALQMLVATIKTPALPQGELDRLIQDRKDALQDADRDWDSLLREKIRRTAFAGHYAGGSRLGTRESLDNLSRQSLRELHATLSGAKNLVFSIHGHHDTDEVRERLEQMIDAEPELRHGQVYQPTPTPWPEDGTARTIHEPSEGDVAALAMVWHAPAREQRAEQGPAFDILTAMLAGNRGGGGRLGQALAGNGDITADEFQIVRRSHLGRGTWGVLIRTRPEHLDRAQQVIRDAVSKLVEDLGAGSGNESLATEIARARELCVTRHLLAAEDLETTAERLAAMVLAGRGEEILADGYEEEIAGVGPDDLLVQARRWLAPQPLLIKFAPEKPEGPPDEGEIDGDQPAPREAPTPDAEPPAQP